MTEHRGNPVEPSNYMGGNVTPSVMASSLASTLSTDFFGGGDGGGGRSKMGGGSKTSASTPQQKEAVVISHATATAISAARSIILTGGTHSSAISTAQAAAFSILSPTHDGGAKGKRTGFLARRKCKQQAKVIASMAVVSVCSALEATKPKVYTVSDPTVLFMEQQSRLSLSKGNTTESTTDDLSWHKDFTRSTADSQPPLETPPAMQQQQQLHKPATTIIGAVPPAAVVNTATSPTNSENMGDSSFLTCETPTSCNVSQTSSMVTPFGYFRNKHQRDESTLPQMGRKMQLDIIQSQDRSYETDEEDDSSYSGDTTNGNSTTGSTEADTQDFSSVPTDYTDISDDRVENEHDKDRKHKKNRKQGRGEENDSDDDDDEYDDSDDDARSRRRAVVPAQLQTSNLFEDHILAALTDLCTPNNDAAVSPPSSQRHTNRTFAFDKQRDDPTDGNLSDDTDGCNGSSVLGSYFVSKQLDRDDSRDWASKKNQVAAAPKAVAKDGIEQVVLRALASTILPGVGREQVDEKLVCFESQSQPTSPRSEAKYILPGTYIRNEPISAPKCISPRRQRSYSESRVDVTEARRHRSPMSRQLSPRRKHHNHHDASVGWSSEFSFSNNNTTRKASAAQSPATTMKKSNTTSSAWFRWKKQNGQKTTF